MVDPSVGRSGGGKRTVADEVSPSGGRSVVERREEGGDGVDCDSRNFSAW